MNIIYQISRVKNAKKCEKHSHDMWEVILTLEGIVKTEIDKKIYYMQPGDLVAIPPGIEHSEFSEDGFGDMYFRTDKLDLSGIVLIHDFDRSIYTLMDMLLKCCMQKDKGHLLIEDKLVSTIILYIKRNLHNNSKYPFVEKLKNTIYNNISNTDFSLNEQIKKSGYNTDYLRRIFKSETGITPLEYLTDLRINQAKTLLLQNNFMSIDDVAKACGFNDKFYFSTCFKKSVGLSPLKYRKQFL